MVLEVAKDREERINVFVSVAWWQEVHVDFVVPILFDQEGQESEGAPVLIFSVAIVCLNEERLCIHALNTLAKKMAKEVGYCEVWTVLKPAKVKKKTIELHSMVDKTPNLQFRSAR